MTNQTSAPTSSNIHCPQCNRMLTLDELPHNACTKCQSTIGRVLQVQPGAPLTHINTNPVYKTPINGESHD